MINMISETTEYFRISGSHLEADILSGRYNAELLDLHGGYSSHLAPGFESPQKDFAHRLAAGSGHFVVEGVSPEGFRRICQRVSALTPVQQEDRREVARAVTELHFITWDKYFSGH